MVEAQQLAELTRCEAPAATCRPDSGTEGRWIAERVIPRKAADARIRAEEEVAHLVLPFDVGVVGGGAYCGGLLLEEPEAEPPFAEVLREGPGVLRVSLVELPSSQDDMAEWERMARILTP